MSPRARAIAARSLLLASASLGACTTVAVRDAEPIAGHSRLPPVPALELTQSHEAVRDQSPGDYLTTERCRLGYTIVVVGVNGDNMLSAGLAPGLIDGGYEGAVDVIDWTTGHWPLFLYHLRSGRAHDAGARAIGDKVAAYRAQYPGREINLIGYSAGAAVVLQALEQLPSSEHIDRAILLAAAVSPAHDLRPALARCRVGLWNYYQPQDVVALWTGTLLAGTADGAHVMSAGAIGFWPLKMAEAERTLYEQKLVQLAYNPRMALAGNLGGHFQCVNRRFIAQWITPMLSQSSTAETAQTNRNRGPLRLAAR